jgi:hypothetical protein
VKPEVALGVFLEVFVKTSQFERFPSKPAHTWGPDGPFSPGNPVIEVGGEALHLDRRAKD